MEVINAADATKGAPMVPAAVVGAVAAAVNGAKALPLVPDVFLLFRGWVVLPVVTVSHYFPPLTVKPSMTYQ